MSIEPTLRPTNIYEPDVIMDMLVDFFHSVDVKVIEVGGICGSPLLRTVLDTSTVYCRFEDILIVDGCPDIIYMKKAEQNVANHIYYKNLFTYKPIAGDEVFPFDPYCLKRRPKTEEYHIVMNNKFIDKYSLLIINNAHLIDKLYLDAFIDYFRGKVILCVDPFDMFGETWINVPTITRSFRKVPNIIGMAREIWDIETDMINKAAKGGVYYGKIRRNSIGSNTKYMYVCDNEEVINQARKKQSVYNIRKDQRWLITDSRIMMYQDSDKFTHHLSNGDLIVAGTQNVHNARQSFRIFKSSKWIWMNVREDDTNKHTYHDFVCGVPDFHKTKVVPGNIIDTKTMALHRFGSLIYIDTDDSTLTRRKMYSLMKNSITLTVCKIKV